LFLIAFNISEDKKEVYKMEHWEVLLRDACLQYGAKAIVYCAESNSKITADMFKTVHFKDTMSYSKEQLQSLVRQEFKNNISALQALVHEDVLPETKCQGLKNNKKLKR